MDGNITMNVILEWGDKEHRFTVSSRPSLASHPNAWMVTRDNAFIGYIFKDGQGYSQTHSAVLLMPDIVDAIAADIERQLRELGSDS